MQELHAAVRRSSGTLVQDFLGAFALVALLITALLLPGVI